MTTIGLDIGGANLKASDGCTLSLTRPFALWKCWRELPEALREVLSRFESVDQIAVTMTGELADCYASKSDGVSHILDCVEASAGGRPVRVWQTAGEFVSTTVAREFPQLTAAANWHALATWVGRAAPAGGALLLDVGSTTTDVIPLQDGIPMPRGRTDAERLLSGELVYSGVRRTPLAALAHSVPFREGSCALAAELFATTLDVYLWLGDLNEDPDSTDTANSRPATRSAAHDRLARMLCCDRTEFRPEDADVLAGFLADVQRQRIAGCVGRVVRRAAGSCQLVVTAGEGEFLAERVIATERRLRDCPVLSLERSLGRGHSGAACAHAVAQLGAERGLA